MQSIYRQRFLLLSSDDFAAAMRVDSHAQLADAILLELVINDTVDEPSGGHLDELLLLVRLSLEEVVRAECRTAGLLT